MISSADVNLSDVGELLGRDPGVSARLLKMVNSATFAPRAHRECHASRDDARPQSRRLAARPEDQERLDALVELVNRDYSIPSDDVVQMIESSRVEALSVAAMFE